MLATTTRGAAILGSARSFNPLTLSPVLWLKADSLIAADGDLVTTWADSSGNGHDATQATAAKKPVFKSNIINGKPVLRFDGIDDVLTMASTINGALQNVGQASMFSVASAQVSSGARTLLFVSGGGTISTTRMRTLANATSTKFGTAIIRTDGGGSNTVESDLLYNAGQPYVQTGEANFAGGTVTIYIDGTQSGQVASVPGNTSNTLSLAACVGARSTTDFLNGDVAEAFLFNKILSVSERLALHRYLGAKYGIPTP